MVYAVKSIAQHVGASCYADPFLPTTDDAARESVLTRAMGWLGVSSGRQMGQVALDRPRDRREPPMQGYGRPVEAYGSAEARVRSH
jgi:hypothetical protein